VRNKRKRKMNELALFAGAGGGILGGKLLGWETVCAVENNEYCRNVLVARQNDGTFRPFPIWDDVRTFDGSRWQGLVDIVSGGFPCQDISVSRSVGAKGIEGTRSGLWKEQARIIREVQPVFAWVENSPALTVRGLGVVLADLAEMGFDAEWGVLGANHCNGPIKRERIWVLAFSVSNGLERWNCEATSQEWETEDASIPTLVENCAWPIVSDPRAYGSNNGLAYRKQRLTAIGNGQIPAVVRQAWRVLRQRIGLKKNTIESLQTAGNTPSTQA
jgi:DNA (cytosine-5)-methyltransferase 1